MNKIQKIRDQWKRGELSLGTAVALTDAAVSELFGEAGYDFVWIDCRALGHQSLPGAGSHPGGAGRGRRRLPAGALQRSGGHEALPGAAPRRHHRAPHRRHPRCQTGGGQFPLPAPGRARYGPARGAAVRSGGAAAISGRDRPAGPADTPDRAHPGRGRDRRHPGHSGPGQHRGRTGRP